MKKTIHNKTKVDKKTVLGRKSDAKKTSAKINITKPKSKPKKAKKQAKISAHKTALNKGLHSKNAVIKAKSEKLYQALYTKKGTPRKRISQKRIESINADIKELKRVEYINSPKYQRDIKAIEMQDKAFNTGLENNTWENRQEYDNALNIWKNLAKSSLSVKLDSSDVVEIARTYKASSNNAKVLRVLKYIKQKMEDDVPPLFQNKLTSDDTYRAISHGLNLEENGIKLQDLTNEEAVEIISMSQEPSAEYIENLKNKIKERKKRK